MILLNLRHDRINIMPVVNWKADTPLRTTPSRSSKQQTSNSDEESVTSSSANYQDNIAENFLSPWSQSSIEAARWNSLIIWQRGKRGAQWDAGTGVFVFCLILTRSQMASTARQHPILRL